jgi:nicotinate-nucleotide adenylyltransferase
MKTGILGGTFDPIHRGHIMVADVVEKELGLNEVVFIIAGQPWLKSSASILSSKHRLNMVRLATAGKSSFSVATMEIDRKGPTYSIYTIAEMRREMGGDDDLFFIIGWDNLEDLPKWHQIERLISLCRLVVVPRVDFPVPNLEPLEVTIPGITHRVIMLDKPQVDVSSSVIRERVRHGLPIDNLVPKVVKEYIIDNGLYKE